ncbi:hypothetical protein [Streptomyces pratensis]|uniref:hypothetical protein n=1 Tax=Streptomyces pratensis TaxID=1169025 RepID=UPI001931C5B2
MLRRVADGTRISHETAGTQGHLPPRVHNSNVRANRDRCNSPLAPVAPKSPSPQARSA